MKKENCDICNGTGWVIKEKRKNDFAQRCECQFTDILVSKSENANIPKRFIGFELKTYFTNKNDPSQEKAKKAVQKFINDFPAVEKGLLLKGSMGVGKTRLLCAIATELIKKTEDIDLYYIDWNDLIRTMRSGEGHSTRDFYAINQIIEKLSNVYILLFDELGGSDVSPWVRDNIYYLFNKRYNNNNITVCATNYYDDASEKSLSNKIGNRIRSRLYEMTMDIEIKGFDYRHEYR